MTFFEIYIISVLICLLLVIPLGIFCITRFEKQDITLYQLAIFIAASFVPFVNSALAVTGIVGSCLSFLESYNRVLFRSK